VSNVIEIIAVRKATREEIKEFENKSPAPASKQDNSN